MGHRIGASTTHLACPIDHSVAGRAATGTGTGWSQHIARRARGAHWRGTCGAIAAACIARACRSVSKIARWALLAARSGGKVQKRGAAASATRVGRVTTQTIGSAVDERSGGRVHGVLGQLVFHVDIELILAGDTRARDVDN